MHCFLKMLSIFSTTFRLNWNFSFHKTIKHPQKSNPRKSIKFFGRMKSIFIFWFGFFIHPKNLIPFPKTTIFQINSQSFKQNPIIRWRLVNEIKTKNKKKEGKGKFQVYKKASSSLRFLIKSPPYRVVFYQKNLLFWNPPLERMAFFFFLFFLLKNLMGGAERSTLVFQPKPCGKLKI